MSDLSVIEDYLDSKSQAELAVIVPPDPPAPVKEPLTSTVVEQMLQLARNGSSKKQILAVVRINGRRLTKKQGRLFWREWQERLEVERAAAKAAKKAAKKVASQ